MICIWNQLRKACILQIYSGSNTECWGPAKMSADNQNHKEIHTCSGVGSSDIPLCPFRHIPFLINHFRLSIHSEIMLPARFWSTDIWHLSDKSHMYVILVSFHVLGPHKNSNLDCSCFYAAKNLSIASLIAGSHPFFALHFIDIVNLSSDVLLSLFTCVMSIKFTPIAFLLSSVIRVSFAYK